MTTRDISATLDLLEEIKRELVEMPEGIDRMRKTQAMISLLLHLEYIARKELEREEKAS